MLFYPRVGEKKKAVGGALFISNAGGYAKDNFFLANQFLITAILSVAAGCLCLVFNDASTVVPCSAGRWLFCKCFQHLSCCVGPDKRGLLDMCHLLPTQHTTHKTERHKRKEQ